MTDLELLKQIEYWLKRAKDLKESVFAYERGMGEGYLICAERLQAELDARKALSNASRTGN